MSEKIAIGLSGGVDSSYAAYMLKKQGYDLIGVTGVMSDAANTKVGQQAVEDARMVAKQLEIPFYVIDLRDDFSKYVIKYFENEYKNGRTPSPCVICNPAVKFGVLLKKSMELGADKIATGHYVRLEHNTNGFHLYKGLDQSKDQSYFLCRLTQQHLKHALFPLGQMYKSEVKELIKDSGLNYVQRGESQEICFIEDDDYVKYLENRIDTKSLKGYFYDTSGNKIAKHNGIHSYTVGQRKGLGIAIGKPAYVTNIDPETNRIDIGERDDTFSSETSVRSISWIREKPATETITCDVQVRYRHKPAKADIKFLEKERALISFQEPQFAVAPGQSAAFYDGEELLGGAWIE